MAARSMDWVCDLAIDEGPIPTLRMCTPDIGLHRLQLLMLSSETT
jgi:hypothetical protein